MSAMLETFQNRVRLVRSPWLILSLLVIIGAVLRFVVNDVATYSPADEAHYVDVTRWLSREGLSAYPKFVSTYLEGEAMWLSPTPLRWGYFSLTTLTCSVVTPCDGRAIAWLSTIAGVLSLVLTYLLGQKLVGRQAALVATAVTIVSPLQLALGRRALQDEVYNAAFLAAFWTFTRLFDANDQDSSAVIKRRWAWFIAASTLAFSIKESFVFPYASLVVLHLFARTVRTIQLAEVGAFLVPPLLFCLGFVLLGHDPSAIANILRLQEASFTSDYSLRYQSGPAHRPLFDLFLLAPVVCVVATGAMAKITERLREGGRERWLAGFLILTLAAFMGLPKSLRFVVILDPVLRLLAAWFVVNHASFGKISGRGKATIMGLFMAINGFVEYSLFDTIFRRRNVYDPTTFDLLNALGAIPGSILPEGAVDSTLAAVLAFTGAGLVMIGVWKQAMTEQNENAESPTRLRPPVLIALGVASLLAAFFAGRLSVRNDAGVPPNANLGNSQGTTEAQAKPRDPMAEGLDALYTQKDPAKAVARFREVLAADPTHYGATYQLATALEQAHDLPAARATWAKMLTLAEASRDEATITQARARMAALEPPPPVVPAPVVEDPLAEPMRLGLTALYEKKDPNGAAKYFRDVLAKNPTHYGATFQLASALEQAGKHNEAKPFWAKTLEMADAIKDTQTAAIARKHLGKTVVFGGFQ